MKRLELNLNSYRLLGWMTLRYVTATTVLFIDQLQMGSVSVPYPVVSRYWAPGRAEAWLQGCGLDIDVYLRTDKGYYTTPQT